MNDDEMKNNVSDENQMDNFYIGNMFVSGYSNLGIFSFFFQIDPLIEKSFWCRLVWFDNKTLH